MANRDMGRVTPIYQGVYSATTRYELNDIVMYTDGYIYWHVGTTATTGTAPTDTSVWKLAARDGKSAYEYAVEAGYEGTEDEFMQLLVEATEMADRMDQAEADIDDLETDKVDNTTTVNGKALSDNVVIDAGDINVDDTAESPETIQSVLTQQSQQIALKADKTALADTDYKAEAALALLKGVVYDVETDTADAYSKTIKSGVVDGANKATVNSYSGHSEVVEGELVSADVDEIVSNSKNLWGGEDFADDCVNQRGETKSISAKTITSSSTKSSGVYPSNGFSFKENTQYTFIFCGWCSSKTSAGYGRINLQIVYTDGTTENLNNFPQGNTSETPTISRTVSDSDKTIQCIKGYNAGGTARIRYDLSGVFEGVITSAEFSPYGALDSIPISSALRTAFPLRSAPSVHDEYDFTNMKHIARVGSRAHAEGDEDDPTVITDGTTTYYALATPVETDISSYFAEGFKAALPVESGGNITYEQTETEFAIPNSISYIRKLSEVTA